ncbi:MAG TPA: DUF4440 domain-containing protein [Gemmatimonadaceae bacterium]|nr:DUF4440 domain-containing protein [Gemmatimonadaceae bacterium]
MTAEESIRATIASFASAYRAGRLGDLLDTYSDELIKTRAGAPPENKPETAERLRHVMAHYETDIAATVDELCVSGDLAYARGAFTVVLRPRAGGEATTIARRYLEIWRNEGGTWRVVRTMDNQA